MRRRLACAQDSPSVARSRVYHAGSNNDRMATMISGEMYMASRHSHAATSAIVWGAALVGACMILAPIAVHAQASDESSRRVVMERVVAPEDSTRSSAVMLPSKYSTD